MSVTFFSGTIAVVGATDKQSSFGYKVFNFLLDTYPEHTVIPINPRLEEIQGHPCFHSLQEISQQIDTIVMIVNPNIGSKIFKDIVSSSCKKIWFQPGSESEELESLCKTNHITYSMGACLLH
jgi:uncharacterized protein